MSDSFGVGSPTQLAALADFLADEHEYDDMNTRCECGWYYGSPESYSEHIAVAVFGFLRLTEERHTFEAFETKPMMGGEGALRCGGQSMRSLGYRTQSRLVGPWVGHPGGES